MFRFITLMLLLSFAVACGSPNTPTASAPAATSAPATVAPPAPTTAPAAAKPTDTPKATLPAGGQADAPKPAAPTTAPMATPQATATAAPAAKAAGEMRLTLDPAATKARFRVKEQFANQTVMAEAVGETDKVTGQIVLDATGKINRDQSKFTVDMNSLKTDQAQRDNFIKRGTLGVSQFPTAQFVPTEIKGLAAPLPTSGEVQFQLVGDMTVRGITKPVTWDVTGKIEGQSLVGQAKTAFKFGDFGMEPPRVPILAAVEDNIRLELDFKATAQ